jgi:hypothetical protein
LVWYWLKRSFQAFAKYSNTGQVNAHRGKVRKASLAAFPLRIVEEELRRIPSKGWAAMIRKVYEVDPMTCPQCGGAMKVIAFLTEHAVVDRIIDHLKLTFVAERPPPPQAASQELLMAAALPAFEQAVLLAAEEREGYF